MAKYLNYARLLPKRRNFFTKLHCQCTYVTLTRLRECVLCFAPEAELVYFDHRRGGEVPRPSHHRRTLVPPLPFLCDKGSLDKRVEKLIDTSYRVTHQDGSNLMLT